MRDLKWISALMILALLCAMLLSAVAEDDLEIEGASFEEFDVLDDMVCLSKNGSLDLDDLVNDPLIIGMNEPTGALEIANSSDEFEIDEEGILTRYRGFDKIVVIPDGVTVTVK